MKGLRKKSVYIKHRQQWGDGQRRAGGGRWRWAKEGEMGMERDWVMGTRCGEHVMFLLSRPLESCMAL